MAGVFGHPLIVNDQFLALTQDDLLMRWQPFVSADFITIGHPSAGIVKPDHTPVAQFGGFPMAQTPTGIVVADDLVNPFISVFFDPRTPVWYRDVLNRLGIPCVEGNRLFINAGGEGAVSALVALDSRTGFPLWTYAPDGFDKEPIYVEQRQVGRPPTAEERQQVAALKQAAKSRGLGNLDDEVKVTSLTPMINGNPGHWDNPGLVVAFDRVFGQVGNKIVALGQHDGSPIWTYGLRRGEKARSTAASKDHLFVSLDRRLIALNLQTGALDWTYDTLRAGTISIANGRLFLAMGADSKDKDGGELLVFEVPKPKEESDDGN